MTDQKEKTENSKITLNLVMSWGVGGACFISGISKLITGSAEVGLCFLLIGCLLLPPVRTEVYKKTKKSLSTGIRVIFVLALLGTAGSMIQKTTGVYSGDRTSSILPSSSSKLDVESFSIKRGKYGIKNIIGVLKNTTNKQYSYTSVVIGDKNYVPGHCGEVAIIVCIFRIIT